MDTNHYHSEYLLIFSEERKLIQNEEDLTQGLKLNRNLVINESNGETSIAFKELSFDLNIKKIKSKSENFRSYLIKMKNNDALETLDKKLILRDLNKELIATIKELQHSQLNTLRDDLATEFAIEGYKHIHEIENKMRKLITIFMSTKVGLEWISSNIPQEVIDSIKNKNDKHEAQSINTFLSETDFIQLSKFLFNKYSTIKTNDVQRILLGSQKTIDTEKLMEFVPKSNWQRYFAQDAQDADENEKNLKSTAKTIKNSEDKLIEAWEMLYDLRNKVAHNRFITYEDKQKIISKKEEIDGVINIALSKIDDLEVTQEQKKEIKIEIKTTITEDTGNDVSIGDNEISQLPGEEISKEAENTIKKLTRYIYMSIHDSYKKELRKYRSSLNKSLERYKDDSKNQTTKGILELELSRSKEYLSALKQII
jgi:hypothetical protein